MTVSWPVRLTHQDELPTGLRNGLPSIDSPLLNLPVAAPAETGLPNTDSTPLNLLAAAPPLGLPTTDSPPLTLPIGVAPAAGLPNPEPPTRVGVTPPPLCPPPPSPLFAATLPLNSRQSAFQFSMLLTNSTSTVVVVPGVLGDDPAGELAMLMLRVISSPAGDDRHSVSTARSSRRRWRRAESEARRSEVRVVMVDSRVTMWVAAEERWVRRLDWIFWGGVSDGGGWWWDEGGGGTYVGFLLAGSEGLQDGGEFGVEVGDFRGEEGGHVFFSGGGGWRWEGVFFLSKVMGPARWFGVVSPRLGGVGERPKDVAVAGGVAVKAQELAHHAVHFVDLGVQLVDHVARLGGDLQMADDVAETLNENVLAAIVREGAGVVAGAVVAV